MDSIFKNDWNALSDDLFLPMFNSGRVFNFKRLFSREDPPAQPATPAAPQTPAPTVEDNNVWVKILDVKGWEPSEIELVVTADGKQLMVSGEKEEETKNDEGESYDLRRFKQTIDLPEGLDEEEISSALSKDGKLMITAPYLSPQQEVVKQQNIAVQHNEEKKSNTGAGRQLLLRQDSKIEKSWNRIFDDFFSPVFESSGLHSNDEFWSDSSAALTKHRNHISQTMNNAIAKRFNFNHESRLENWDQVFDEFFFPMFQTNRFFHSNRGAAGGLFSSTAACDNNTVSSNATNAVSKKDSLFETEFNLLGYQPSDIKVQVTDGVLTVEAMQEQEEKAEGCSYYKMKQFRRAMTVPRNVDVEKLTSSLGEDGKLRITCPLLAIEA